LKAFGNRLVKEKGRRQKAEGRIQEFSLFGVQTKKSLFLLPSS
jgi:hypothetical protein